MAEQAVTESRGAPPVPRVDLAYWNKNCGTLQDCSQVVVILAFDVYRMAASVRRIRFEQIDVDLDNTDRIPSSSVETSTPVVNRTVAWR
jgi:hypothetical protein